MFRLFVGIALASSVRRRLAFVCGGVPGARWVDPDHMHLTLRFIGEVGGDRAQDVHEALSDVRAPAFELTLSGIGCFETGGKVHTLWAGVDRQPLLAHLHDKVESAIVRAGCEPERRKFKPHVTLARFRDGSPARLGRFLQDHGRLSSEPFEVDEFTLFRSHLGHERAHYEALAEYPLTRYAALSDHVEEDEH